MKGWRGRGRYHLNIGWRVAAATTSTAVGQRTSLKEGAVRLGDEVTCILVEAGEQGTFVVCARDEVGVTGFSSSVWIVPRAVGVIMSYLARVWRWKMLTPADTRGPHAVSVAWHSLRLSNSRYLERFDEAFVPVWQQQTKAKKGNIRANFQVLIIVLPILEEIWGRENYYCMLFIRRPKIHLANCYIHLQVANSIRPLFRCSLARRL